MTRHEREKDTFKPHMADDYLLYLEEKVEPRTKKNFILSSKSQFRLSGRVVDALERVDRCFFVPEGVPSEYLYSACIFPLVENEDGERTSTVSWPEIVAEMSGLLDVQEGDRILEVGGGSGYQMGVLARLAGDKGIVHGIEHDAKIATWGSLNLRRAGVYNALMHTGDGSKGLDSYEPFDRVIISASVPPHILEYFPPFRQLRPGGRLVAPFGGFGDKSRCHMAAIGKNDDGTAFLAESVDYRQSRIFVPLQGLYGWDEYRNGLVFAQAMHNMSELGWGVSHEEYFAHLKEG